MSVTGIFSVMDRYLYRWVNFWVAFYCFSALVLQSHGGDAALVLLFTALLFIWRGEGVIQPIRDVKERWFIYAVWLFLLISLLGVLFQPEGLEFESVRRQLRAFDGVSRWLLLLPLFYMFSRMELSWRQLSIGLSIGIFAATWISVNQVYWQGVGRAYGAIGNPIPFGELLVVADLFTWVLMIHAWNCGEKKLGILLLLASLTAFYAAMLTGTRGALLAYGIMVLVTIVQIFRQKSVGVKSFFSRLVIVRLMGFLLIFGVVSQTDQYQMVEMRTMQDIQRFDAASFGDIGGGRGAMAQLALVNIQQYPFGGGTDNYKAIARSLMDENSLGWSEGRIQHLMQFNQIHNEWLNVLVENGIQGIITLFLIFGLAATIFWRGLGDERRLIGVYSAAGLMLLASYFVFGLTQAVFSHNVTTIFFVLFLYLFIGQIRYLRSAGGGDRDRL